MNRTDISADTASHAALIVYAKWRVGNEPFGKKSTEDTCLQTGSFSCDDMEVNRFTLDDLDDKFGEYFLRGFNLGLLFLRSVNIHEGQANVCFRHYQRA